MNAPATIAALAAAVAEGKPTEAIYAAAAAAAKELIGYRLFTVLALDGTDFPLRVQRAYSANPDTYPPGGVKEKGDTPWTCQVLIQGRPFIGRSADDIRENFNDFELLHSLGCDAILNVPAVVRGRVAGTVNMSGAAGHFNESHIAWGQVIAGLVAPVIELPG